MLVYKGGQRVTLYVVEILVNFVQLMLVLELRETPRRRITCRYSEVRQSLFSTLIRLTQ